MNCIPLITKESEIFSETSVKVIVYMYLLSTAKAERGGLYSDFDLDDIQSRFRFLDEEEIEEAIDELIEEELICKRKSKLQVGIINDGVRKLYIGLEAETESFFKMIYTYANDYINDSSSSLRSNIAQKIKSDLEAFEEMNPAKMNNNDFIKLFGLCYNAVMQEPHREWMTKDFGQMKNFAKLYDHITVVQMILYYFANYETWNKSPSLGNLIFHKDDVYAGVKGKTKKKITSKSVESHERGF